MGRPIHIVLYSVLVEPHRTFTGSFHCASHNEDGYFKNCAYAGGVAGPPKMAAAA